MREELAVVEFFDLFDVNLTEHNTLILLFIVNLYHATFPVEAIKPLVLLNVPNATFLITQPLCAVISEG